MTAKDYAKRFGARLPYTWQQELKRYWYGRQIQRADFSAGEPETQVLSEYVGAGDWVVDVGANIGQYSWQLSKLVGPEGRVIAIEPIPETFALLSANIQKFEHRNVSLFNVALSDRGDVAEMFIPRFDTGLLNYYQASLRHHRSPEQGGYSVLTLRFDELGFRHRISLIKIDAEGHDEYVLAGMQGTLERDRPVLIIESPTHPTVKRLSVLGYAPRVLSGSPNTIFVAHGTPRG